MTDAERAHIKEFAEADCIRRPLTPEKREELITASNGFVVPSEFEAVTKERDDLKQQLVALEARANATIEVLQQQRNELQDKLTLALVEQLLGEQAKISKSC